MRKSGNGGVVIGFVFLAATSTSAFAGPAPSSQSSTEAVIRQAVAVNTIDWQAQLHYSYDERDIKSKVDGTGKVQSAQSKTYRTSLLYGSPYGQLLEINGEPISRPQRTLEATKLKNESERRRNESAGKRRSRVSQFEIARADEHLLMEQMALAFQFRLIGEETVNGALCYRFTATPKADYVPPVEKARVLLGMRGQMWIDKLNSHWVKVEAQVIQPVSFGFFIAQVKPGTQFELDQMPVGEYWLPHHFIEKVNASVFGLYGYRTQEESVYSNYQPAAGSEVVASR